VPVPYENHIYTVSQLNNESNVLLSTHFETVWVSGEISNLSRPSSGHLYFSLKDDFAQVRCAFFRFQQQRIDFNLENGQAIIVRAQVGLYEPRGDYQLIVSEVTLAGAGKLQIAFEKLKKELEKKGYFDEQHKQPLPVSPQYIGVITSPTAAALRDILKVLKKRAPHIPIMIYPTLVQGDQAAAQIANAIQAANQHKLCDALILARGGGSIEDLWSFNEAVVAKAIFDSKIPIVTGIGHQTDFTIADFVADVRAPTPSAAAEIIAPDREELNKQLSHYLQRVLHLIRSQLQLHRTHLLHLQKRLQHPGEKCRQQSQQLDQLEMRMLRVIQHQLILHKEKIAHYAQLLNNLSPLMTLQRGFSITRLEKTNQIIKKCHDTQKNDVIVTQLVDGEIKSVVM
jgi:exodeoxyribonuclease VII large subunit